MKIAVVGTGYVGLVTGTCFADIGNDVTCVDIDKDKVAKMQKGIVPIYEPELETLFKRNIEQDRLKFTTDLKQGINGAEVIFLALPTPPNGDGTADLSYILGVGDDLGKIIDKYCVIIDKSTVPVGTAEKVRQRVAKNAKVEFDVVSNPEFLREGFAVADFMKPNRIVIGTSSDKAKKVMSALYEPYIRQDIPIFFMDERSAEMTKYAANAFLATKISFMNEVANLCELTGADVDSVRLGIGSDERIGKQFLYPGIGYGGSCFPKDVMAISKTAQEYGTDFRIVDTVAEINEKQKLRLVTKIQKYYGDVSGKHFAMWGLAFKPDTDDIREAPAITIIQELTAAGATITAYDPEAADNIARRFKDNSKLALATEQYAALKDADALLIVTEWDVFKNPDFTKIKKELKAPVIFDGRNLFDLDMPRKSGFYYASIGRQIVKA